MYDKKERKKTENELTTAYFATDKWFALTYNVPNKQP